MPLPMGQSWKSSREMVWGEGLRLLPFCFAQKIWGTPKFIFTLIGVSSWSMSVVADTMIYITP